MMEVGPAGWPALALRGEAAGSHWCMMQLFKSLKGIWGKTHFIEYTFKSSSFLNP